MLWGLSAPVWKWLRFVRATSSAGACSKNIGPRFRSMTTLELSQPTLFEPMELPLMSSAQAGLVRTSVPQAQDLAWTEYALDYGATSSVWLASYSPSSSSFWRTRQLCLATNEEDRLAEF